MSVIVYDPETGVMAADSRAYAGDTHPVGQKLKAHRIEKGPLEGSLLGITSSQPGFAECFKNWVTDGMMMEDIVNSTPDIEALLVKPDGSIFYFYDGYVAAGPLTGKVFTLGSGKRYALGAFIAGATASEAVEIACQCDTMCGLPVTTLSLHERAPGAAAGEAHA